MNTIMRGDQFRDKVADLLRAAGYTATSEILDEHKRIDIIFEQTTFGKRRRYALEAKNWNHPLDHSDLEHICAGYASFIVKRTIDELLIVSPQPLKSPAAKAFIRDTPGISHLSINEFQESIMGFHEYLSSFSFNHETDGLEDYFIPPLLDSGEVLEKYVGDWLDAEASGPLAIIASYGMGKTSFARHLAYGLSKRFLSGEPCRIPIVVSLGNIAREQSLEGLIGSVLAGSRPTVANYSFPLFYHLNSIGRFLVILDGFDEMKHMMTWSDFQSNFEELNRLATGKARIILLGRPTAFLSENERAYALRGTLRIGKTDIQTLGSPNYEQITLCPFSPSQIQDFLYRYLTHHQKKGDIQSSPDFILRRQQEINEKEQEGLLSRPIHARMLADIATDPTIEISGISRFSLYDHFIDHLVRRELKKPGRGRIYKSQDLRQFACSLAWYLWTPPNASGIGCRLDDLPDQLFLPFQPRDEDLSSVKRDLLSGSLLDEKNGGVYYFSHRSFQEFLVAEYIWDAVNEEARDDDSGIMRYLEKVLTHEVFDFIIEREDQRFFRSLLSMLPHHGPYSPEFFAIIASSEVARGICMRRSKPSFTSWDAAILIASSFLSDSVNCEFLGAQILVIADKADQKPNVIVAAIMLLISFASARHQESKLVAPFIAALLFSRAETDLRLLAQERKRKSAGDELRNIIFDTVTSKTSGDSLIMSIHIREFCTKGNHLIQSIIRTETLEANISATCNLMIDEFLSQIPAARHSVIREFYTSDANAMSNT